jgi:hypothetical protein
VVDLLATDLLGRAVPQRADRHTHRGEAAVGFLRHAGDTEIGELDRIRVHRVGAGGDQDVAGFDVAMQQPFAVGVVETVCDLRDDPHGEARMQRPTREKLRCIGTRDELHRDPQLALMCSAVENVDEVGVTQRRDQVRLALETRSGVRVGAVRAVEQFDRVGTRQSRMLSLVDLTHPATADQLQDLIATDVGTDRHAHLLCLSPDLLSAG